MSSSLDIDIDFFSDFNINSLLDNEFYYTFLTKCNNSKMLECLIHNFLSPFVYKNELFQLHYKPLSNIVKEISIPFIDKEGPIL